MSDEPIYSVLNGKGSCGISNHTCTQAPWNPSLIYLDPGWNNASPGPGWTCPDCPNGFYLESTSEPTCTSVGQVFTQYFYCN
jgi:hypothetical protein